MLFAITTISERMLHAQPLLNINKLPMHNACNLSQTEKTGKYGPVSSDQILYL